MFVCVCVCVCVCMCAYPSHVLSATCSLTTQKGEGDDTTLIYVKANRIKPKAHSAPYVQMSCGRAAWLAGSWLCHSHTGIFMPMFCLWYQHYCWDLSTNNTNYRIYLVLHRLSLYLSLSLSLSLTHCPSHPLYHTALYPIAYTAGMAHRRYTNFISQASDLNL